MPNSVTPRKESEEERKEEEPKASASSSGDLEIRDQRSTGHPPPLIFDLSLVQVAAVVEVKNVEEVKKVEMADALPVEEKEKGKEEPKMEHKEVGYLEVMTNRHAIFLYRYTIIVMP